MTVNDTAVDWHQSATGNTQDSQVARLALAFFNLYALSYTFIHNFVYRISHSLVTVHFSPEIWQFYWTKMPGHKWN